MIECWWIPIYFSAWIELNEEKRFVTFQIREYTFRTLEDARNTVRDTNEIVREFPLQYFGYLKGVMVTPVAYKLC